MSELARRLGGRLRFRLARRLAALPPAWQLRLAGRGPVVRDGLTLDPGLQLLLALRRRRFVPLETLTPPPPAAGSGGRRPLRPAARCRSGRSPA